MLLDVLLDDLDRPHRGKLVGERRRAVGDDPDRHVAFPRIMVEDQTGHQGATVPCRRRAVAGDPLGEQRGEHGGGQEARSRAVDAADDGHKGNVGGEAPEPGLSAEPAGDEPAEEGGGAGRSRGEQAAEGRRHAAAPGATQERRPVVTGDGGAGGECGQHRSRRRGQEWTDGALGDVEAAGDGERSEPGDAVQRRSRDRSAADATQVDSPATGCHL